MTSDTFQQYVSKWNNELRQKNMTILLPVYNCPAHPHIQDLSNIKLVFLPPNATCFAANGHGHNEKLQGLFQAIFGTPTD
jgi:hypothetical protein